MIGPKLIKLNPIQKGELMGRVYLQLTMKVKPNSVSEIVNEISKKVVGCRTFFDGEHYAYTSDKCPTFEIPDNFPNMDHIHRYVSKNYTLPMSQRLACVCYNKDTVVLNVHHASADGGYLKMLVNYLTGHEVPKDKNYHLFATLNEIYGEKFKKYNLGEWDQSSTKVRSQHLPQSNDIPAYFGDIEIPLSQTINYKNGKCKGMTDLLWSSMLLAVSAYNGEFTDAKICNAADGRREIDDLDWSQVNVNSVLSLEAKGITANSTIGEMSAKFRQSLNDKLENRGILCSLKGFATGTYGSAIDYPTFCLSNIGLFPTGDNINDVYVSVSVSNPMPEPGTLILHCFSVGDKVFRGRLFCSPCIMSEKENSAIADGIKHCMTNFSDDVIIKDAITELRRKFSF